MSQKIDPERQRAMTAVRNATRRGKIIRPDTCQLCELTVSDYNLYGGKGRIVAHHWAGYDPENQLNIWWICSSCNVILKGPEFHRGEVSREAARALVANYATPRRRVASGEMPPPPVEVVIPRYREPETLRPVYQPKLF